MLKLQPWSPLHSRWLGHVYLLTLFSLSGCLGSHSSSDSEPTNVQKSAAQALLAAVQLLGGGKEESPQRVQDDLETAQSTATAQEKREIKAMLPIVAKLATAEPVLSQHDYSQTAAVMQQLAKAHPTEFPIQLAAASGLDFIESTLHASITTAPASDSTATSTALTRANDLVARYPNQSLAYAHLGQVLQTSGGSDALGTLRAYARCLQLDPNNAGCRTSLRTLAADYTKPRCTAFDPSRFALHKAYAAAPKSRGKSLLRPVKVANQRLYMDPAIALDGSVINDIAVSPDPAAKTYVFSFSPLGSARFSTLTSQLAANQDYMVVECNSHLVAAPRVLSGIDSGQLVVAQQGIDVKALCKTQEVRTLPADLVGLAR